MSFGQKPQTVVNDPYANMPDWMEDYLKSTVEDAMASNDRIDALRERYSQPGALVAPYAGEEGLRQIGDAASGGMAAAERGVEGIRGAADRAATGLEAARGASAGTLDDVIARLRSSGDRLGRINTDLGAAPDTTASQARLRGLGDDARSIGTTAGAAMGGAAERLRGVSTDLGGAYDTAAERAALTGMDIAGMQDRYQSDYIEGMVDPVLSRMREDEARRLAQLEGSAAAIGGGSNTRMAVEAARLADEAMRSRAQTEAELRQTALREAQSLGLEEAGLRGDLASTAANLGLTQSELEASIRERAASLGISQEQAYADIMSGAASTAMGGVTAAADLESAAAQLGMSQAELEASIRERAAALGISVEEAQRQVLGDIAGAAGAQFGMARDVSQAEMDRARAEESAAQLGMDAARMGMAVGGTTLEEAERRRLIEQEEMRAPLTMETAARGLTATGLPTALPTVNTQTTTGGGAGLGTQLLGAGATILGGYLGGPAGAAAGSSLATSDERVKTDIARMNGLEALATLRAQRPSVYAYDDPALDRIPVEGRRSAGLMAQDLEAVPGAVVEVNGIKRVDPYPVMATIVAAVQALDEKVEAMNHG